MLSSEGSTGPARKTRVLLGFAFVLAALPVGIVFFFAVTVWFLIGTFLCAAGCYVNDELILPLASKICSDGDVDTEAADYQSKRLWQRPYLKNTPQLIPFIVSGSIAVWVVDWLFYRLSKETYLCPHATITFFTYPAANADAYAQAHTLSIFQFAISFIKAVLLL